MRKIKASIFSTLDGVMQSPGAPQEDTEGGFTQGGWLVPHFDETVGQAMEEIFREPFDLLLGRKTYDIMAAHWPNVGPEEPFGAVLDSVNKYVASRNRETKLSWQNSHLLGPDAISALKGLRQGEGKDLLVQGSSDFLQALFGERLIEEFTVLIFPVVAGSGKRLFGDAVAASALKLIESKTSGSGVTINRYQVDGDLVAGAIPLANPA